MKIRNPVGIMQGRLSPRYKGRYQAFPKDYWKTEFSTAKSLGFDCIEFIFDYEEYTDHPLCTENGIEEIRDAIGLSGVGVFSVCADYFMRFPLFDQDVKKRKVNIETLIKLIEKSSLIGISDITIPCVDESSLKNEADIENLKISLRDILPVADKYGINLNLETDLPPDNFYKLIIDLNHPRVKINYDIGNSASLGYNQEEELGRYGQYVSVLHVKDRLYKGGSVRLGTGKADFESVFKKINNIGFPGVIILQAARAEKFSDEINFVKQQFEFLNNCMNKWFTDGSKT